MFTDILTSVLVFGVGYFIGTDSMKRRISNEEFLQRQREEAEKLWRNIVDKFKGE